MWNVFRIKDRLRAFALKVIEADALSRHRRDERRTDSPGPPFQDLDARQGVNRVSAELSALARRFDTFERLLTDHPTVEVGDTRVAALASPAVSVILPTWNRARIVGAAIASVQAQIFKDWELLVIDDGSDDDTAGVMSDFVADDRIRYVRLPHAGQCAARNHGQAIAKGALIAYLDSDNLWYPDFLFVAVNLFTHRPDVACAYGAMVSDSHHLRILFEPFDRQRLLAGNFIDTSTFIHRSELVTRHGGFDPAASPLEDWDLVLRYTVDAPAYPLPVLAVRYRAMDTIRVSNTQDKVQPTRTIRRKWSVHRDPSSANSERQV